MNRRSYLNTDTPYLLFRETINSDIYVDKSMLIEKVSSKIRKTNKYVCITRPRRFGKTINANMLGAYYSKAFDSRNLFAGLQISKSAMYEEHLNKHNVIYIDFSRRPDGCESYQQYITAIVTGLKNDIRKMYPELQEEEYFSMSQMFADTGENFIFILDEWDSVFYEKYMSVDDKHKFLKLLKELLKDQPYVELAYMTGVLPIAKYSSGSELNMFREHNFMNDRIYEEYFGFTEDEVKNLCKNHQGVSFEELKNWYDGYHMSDGRSLFNPRSVTCALIDNVCLNYWTETGPMNEIANCVENNVDAVREDIVKLVAGIPVEIELQGYSASELQLNTRDEILSAMVVYGFLSYYDRNLHIPNCELMEKYQRVLSRDSMGGVKEVVDRSKEMLQATLACDEEKVAAILEYIHDKEIPFLQYNDENSLSCVITLCYLYARNDYIIEREAKSGKGYCDYLFVPRKKDKSAIILELKVGKSPKEAIEQMKKKNYIQKVEHCKEVLFVGISYDKEKKHACRIEKFRQ